jgi:hypothetical protein
MASKLYRFKFPALFLSIESENVWPSLMATFAVLHVERDDQVRRLGKHKLHNNNKVIRKAFFCKTSENYGVSIFVLLLGLVFNTLLFTFFVQF